MAEYQKSGLNISTKKMEYLMSEREMKKNWKFTTKKFKKVSKFSYLESIQNQLGKVIVKLGKGCGKEENLK